MVDQPNTQDLAQQLKKLLELSSDFKTDDDSTLEGEQAVFDKHDEDVSLPSVLIKASHCYAGRSVLHPLSRRATVHVSFSNTRSNSKLHS